MGDNLLTFTFSTRGVAIFVRVRFSYLPCVTSSEGKHHKRENNKTGRYLIHSFICQLFTCLF